ncbi:hypothetical protein X963_5683 [Burkholderia pseudomallei MSHR7498]|nr:hypothetical protein X963_5683 [Burkholderia pseudomallei MSHR7498]
MSVNGMGHLTTQGGIFLGGTHHVLKFPRMCPHMPPDSRRHRQTKPE